jgi:alpha-glucosidase (family GH31 glycosyl hydrolase)
MKWWIESNIFKLELPLINLFIMITDQGIVRMHLGVTMREEPWCSVVVHPQLALPIHVDTVGEDIIIKGSNISIGIKPDLSIVMERDGAVFFNTPGNCIQYEKDTISFRIHLQKDEKIYGLGQDPMANLNQNGKERRMWNQWGGSRRSGNCGIGFYMSDAGYGFLLDSVSDARFRFGKSKAPELDRLGEIMVPSLWKEEDELFEEEARLEIHDSFADLYIFTGMNYADLLKQYYNLTGNPRPMPKWAYGFIQCKNRYMNQEDLLRVGATYRSKGIPCDGLVIDWLWFSDFGDLEWKEEDWPNAEEMLFQLNQMGFHVASAQHPFISEKGKYYQHYLDNKYLNQVPENKRVTYDHTNPMAREYWWQKTKKLYDQGLRGYWIDMGELEEHFDQTVSFAGNRTRTHNGYSYVWTKGLYEGQRRDCGTRPFILSRSGCAGIQQFGTAIWSGDIDASWEVLQDQIVIGQSMAMSGIPNWTETKPDLPYYRDGLKKIFWQKDPEYENNCFGYVDFRRLGPDQNQEEISGSAYAKGTIYTEQANDAEFILRHDSPIKIWVNSEVVFINQEQTRQDLRVRFPLKEGNNVILIKQTAKIPRPYSGGEFGFSLKYTDCVPLCFTL